MNTVFGAPSVRRVFVAAACVVVALAASPVFAQGGQCPPDARIQSIAQSVNEGVTVSPNGNSSKPNDATYLWERVSGPSPVTFSPSATAATVSFVAPQVTGDQQLVIRLTVFGCSGLSHSTTALVTIRDTTAPPTNTAPTAIASANPPIASAGVTVALNGSASTDPENNPLTYSWAQIEGPSVTLANSTSALATFVAPNLTAGATLKFRLTVKDPGNLQSQADVVVNVPFENDNPFAQLTCTGIVREGQGVTLNASGSTDFEDDAADIPLTYSWSQLEGPPNIPVALQHGSSVTFNAPILGSGDDGGIRFEVTVTDSGSLYDTAECSVFIDDVTAPVFSGDGNRTEEATGPDGANVFYDGLAATDNVEGDVSVDIVCVPPSGSQFALDDPTTVECAVADFNGNGSETDFQVLVHDSTKPVIDPHNDIAKEATGPEGATVNYVPPGTYDVVDVDLVATCSPLSGVFAVDSHTVTCNAKDASGNIANPTTFQVTVHDETAPEVTVPGPITKEATSAQGAPVDFETSAYDIVDEAIAPTCTVGANLALSGDTFPLGMSTVVCKAKDTAGNEGVGSFTVTVEDNTEPALTLPSDITEEALGPGGNVVTFSASAVDLVDGPVDVLCVPASGNVFSIATTTVACSATDVAGNTAQGIFTVKIQDTTPPDLTLPEPITLEATQSDGAPVSFTATAHDIVSGDVDVTCVPPSGSTFGLASPPMKAKTTAVQCSASDAAGNTASESFSVTVQDTTAPSLTVPTAVSVEATSAAGAVATWTTSASDTVDGPVTPDCDFASGALFPLGPTTVTCTATDARTNKSAPVSFVVTVVDTTPPDLSLPLDITVEATGPGGATVSFVATAHDIVSGNVTVSCMPASGSAFGLAPPPVKAKTTTVSCSASDAAGNTATETFNVTAQDTTAPTLIVPAAVSVEATGAAGAAATWTATASDTVDGAVVPNCDHASGATFPLGNTTVSCTATDARGNASASKSFVVSVVDTTPPTLTLPANKTEEATGPSGAAVSFPATALDVVSGNVAVTCVPPSGSTFGLAAPPTKAKTTTVNCSASDAAGNTATGSFDVTVRDTTPPSITQQADIELTSAAGSGAYSSWAAPGVTDIVDGTRPLNCSHDSGAWFDVGSTTVTCTASDLRGNTATMTFLVTVSYVFNGFFRPIDNLPTANVVQAGQAIPVKFSLGGNQGLNIFAAGYPKVQTISCAANTIVDEIEETVTAGNSSLSYDAGNNQYIYVWKTEKGWSGTCRQLQVTFRDGSTHKANFTFKK